MSLLFIVGAVLGAYSYRAALEAHGNPLGTLLLEFKPAVLFAAGHGMVYGDDVELPELDAFLAGEAESFDVRLLPYTSGRRHLLANPSNAFPLTHWLLLYSVGWCWRLFGVSHEALQYVCALFYGLSAVALYVLFRLGMGALLSVAGTLFVLCSPPFLAIAPMLRDFSKAPFILFFIAIAGIMLKQRAPRNQFIKYGLALGVTMGVGYGFRQDMLICLPLALLVIVVAPLQQGYRPFSRLGALVLMCSVFAALASPTLMGMRSDSGSVSTHTLFQGLSRRAEHQMAFGDAAYELLLRPDDTETHAVVNAHARKRGIRDKMDLYLSPAYGRAGRQLFLEWARTFPADLFARGLASIETTTRLSSLAVAYHAYEPLADTELVRQLAPYYAWYHRYIERFGLLFLGLALLVGSLRHRYLALAATLVMGWFMAYPNLLFEMRHAFHLSFVTPWAVLFLVGSGIHAAFVLLCGLFAKEQANAPAFKPAALRAGALLLVLTVGATGLLVALRVIQNNNVSALMTAYQRASLERVETVSETAEFHTLVRPAQPLPGLRESWNLPIGDVAAEYLVLEFAPSEYPIAVSLAYQPGRGADFNREILVPASSEESGRALYFVPVYEMANYMPVEFALLKHRFSNTPLANLLVHHWGTNRFQGIRLHQTDAPLLTGVYRVADPSSLPWLLYLRTAETNSQVNSYKQIRLEKELRAIPVEVRLLLNGDIRAAIEAYFELLNRFPGHSRFARRIASLAADMADMEARAHALYRLGRHAPDRAGLIAIEVAAVGDMLREKNALESAGEMYERALMLAPHDRGHQMRLADVLLARGDSAAALKHYEAVLRAAPESPHSAAQFDVLCMAQGEEDRVLDFWRELSDIYPNAAVPALRLGRELERRGDFEESLHLYQHVEEQYPDNAEAVLRQGILVALIEGYAKGREIMDRALSINPDIRPEFVAGLTRVAETYMKTGAHAFAEAIYREVMDLAPDNGWHQVHYAEALMAQENYAMAADVFIGILERDPESPYSAHKLDEIYERTDAPEQRMETWKTLYALNPEAIVPGLHLGKALEGAGELAAALAQYGALHEVHPGQPEAALRLGAVMARLGEYLAGRALMDQALADAPNLASLFVTVLSDVAEQVAATGDLAHAEALYRELAERAPADLWHQVRLAEILTQQERYEEALGLFRDIILAAPESPYSASKMDAIFASQHDMEGRIAAWRDLCAALPEAITPHLHLGLAYEAAGLLEDARAVYAAVLRRAPEEARLQLRHGVLVALLEEYETGRALMDVALAASPQLQGEMAAGLAQIADQLVAEEQYALAESLYREAMVLSPEDYWHHVRLSELLIALERLDEARELLIEVLQARPESPHTAKLLDGLYADKKYNKRRLETWRDIAEAHPNAATPHYHLGLACEVNDRTEDALDAFIETLRIKPDYPNAQEALDRITGAVE